MTVSGDLAFNAHWDLLETKLLDDLDDFLRVAGEFGGCLDLVPGEPFALLGDRVAAAYSLWDAGLGTHELLAAIVSFVEAYREEVVAVFGQDLLTAGDAPILRRGDLGNGLDGERVDAGLLSHLPDRAVIGTFARLLDAADEPVVPAPGV